MHFIFKPIVGHTWLWLLCIINLHINLHQTTCQILQFIQHYTKRTFNSSFDCGHEILKTTIASINICPTLKNCKNTIKTEYIKVTKQFVFCLHCCCCLSVNGKE